MIDKYGYIVSNSQVADAKSRFETIFTIHIHSVQPSPLQDLNVLSDVGREMLETQLKEDPLSQKNKHGMIQNKKVKVSSWTYLLPFKWIELIL
jgi:DNA polymerase delta subunit 3